MEQTAHESSPDARRRRRRRRSRGLRSHQKLRFVYFALASVWGFLSGSAGILIFLASVGTPLRFGPVAVTALSGAGAVAVLGGIIAAQAYREASHRD